MSSPRVAYQSFVAVAALLPLALSSQGCSLLVTPDETRLHPPDGASVDGTAADGAPADHPIASDAPVVPADVATACRAGCDDNVPCTVDECDEAAARCVHTPDNTRCTDGMLCTATDGCMIRPCAVDTECTDGNACNGAERCAAGHCVGGPPLRCDNAQLCDGVETCDPAAGCVPGVPPTCDDAMSCTRDRCDPAGDNGAGACESLLPDADGDGFPAATVAGAACVGGTDCNDGDMRVNPGVREACNGVDDNCNGEVDEGGMCPPVNDACDRAVALNAMGGTAMATGTTVNATNTVNAACGADMGNGGDVWYAVTFPASNDLTVEVEPTGGDRNDPVLVLRDSCTAARDLVCNDDAAVSARTARIVVRPATTSTAMRTAYFVVDAYRAGAEGPFTIRVTSSAPLSAATCGATVFDASRGGSYYGILRATTGSQTGTCTPPGVDRPEDIYRFDGATGRAELRATPVAMFTPSIYVRNATCAMGSEAACDNGSPAMLNFNHTAGTPQYLFVDNGPFTGGRYVLTVIAP